MLTTKETCMFLSTFVQKNCTIILSTESFVAIEKRAVRVSVLDFYVIGTCMRSRIVGKYNAHQFWCCHEILKHQMFRLVEFLGFSFYVALHSQY